MVLVQRGEEESMAARVDRKSEAEAKRSRVSERDALFLLILCADLLRLCAKFVGKIDPAAAAMLNYVGDEITSAD
jgi:hypothetical protein